MQPSKYSANARLRNRGGERQLTRGANPMSTPLTMLMIVLLVLAIEVGVITLTGCFETYRRQ